VNWFLVNTNVKTKYRQSILQKRNSLGLSEISNLSKIILKSADLELSLSAIKTLGSYFSSNNEVDLEALTDMRLKKNLLTTFPRVEPNHSMSLIAPKNFKKLTKNKYNIFEPSDGNEIYPIDHEIIIIPTVAVDKNGYRLGYGGGYYDRFLESVTQRSNRPLLIGLIYDFQFINDSFNELHDVKLDMVFSEQQSKKFS
jgi:5-formyltetrahydrofolate cyclo-ligase